MDTVCETAKYEKCEVRIYPDKNSLGEAAADFAATRIHRAIEREGSARVIFATGASQFEFLQALTKRDVDWKRVTAFHLDEYVGLGEDHPASFRKYLRERLFDLVKPAQVNLLDGASPDPASECQRYARLLLESDIHLACIGIGENGHIAFNDPPVADFQDPHWVKLVELDEACRRQQLGEGWFPTLEDVPTHALTLTVPAILRSRIISCVVPDERKAQAVKEALTGPVDTACPASILRTHSNPVLWLDRPAASLLG